MKKPTIEDVVKQMESDEYPELNWDFIYKLTNESDRGAILIGTSKVEEHLLKLVLIVLPKSTKAYTNYLIKYPGPISSFSGKIELLYAFRIIDENFYSSLNQLRTIRNKAAHTSEEFSLKELDNELKKVNDFDDMSEELINFLSWNNLIKIKRSTVKKTLDEQNIDRKTYKELWKKYTSELHKNESVIEQHNKWRLSYGLTFICLKIILLCNEYEKFDKTKTWLEYQ